MQTSVVEVKAEQRAWYAVKLQDGNWLAKDQVCFQDSPALWPTYEEADDARYNAGVETSRTALIEVYRMIPEQT